MAVVNGNPAISFACQDSIHFLRSSTSTGDNIEDWSQSVTVKDVIMSTYTSLAVVDGNPAISFEEFIDWPDLYSVVYVRATSSTGSSAADWNQLVTVDGPASKIGHSPSLAIVYGHPAIAYVNFDGQELKYVRAASSTGADPSGWSPIERLDSASITSTWHYASMAVVNGNPAVCYTGADLTLSYAYYMP
jgi:hypothetical protein